MIPKIIHYCWLSNEPIPENLQQCMNSWQKYLPDYQIIKWDTKRFNIDTCKLTREAFDAKKWAYAADYIRLHALYTIGGIYLDSDVMLYNDISKLFDSKFISAVEFHPKRKDRKANKEKLDCNGKRITDIIKVFGIGIQAAVIASEPSHPFVKKCLDFYKQQNLESLLKNHHTAPTILAYNAEEYGFVYKDIEQKLNNSIHLYPSSIISHFDQYTKSSFAVHFCAGSWIKKNLPQKILHHIKSNKILYRIYSFINKNRHLS